MENKKNYEAPKMETISLDHRTELLLQASNEMGMLDSVKDINVQV